MADEISVSEFESQRRALLDEVATARAEEVVPIRGSVTFVDRDDDLFTTREW